MKYWLILTGLIFLTACSSNETQEDVPKTPENKDVYTGDLRSKATTHIKSQLKLTAADKLDTAWYAHDITGDGTEDYIVTVNLLDRAINDAMAEGTTEKMQEIGYMGYFNHFFFIDGSTEKISNAVVVPSSPMFKLNVTFLPILGTGKTDFIVDYRVRNMQRRKFFSIIKGSTQEICQAVVFDGLGTSETVAYDIRMEPGTMNDFNDIVEYEAQLEDVIIPNIDSTYTYVPTITPGEKEVRRWHFSPGQRKYFMVSK